MESPRDIEIKIEFESPLKSSKSEDENEDSGLILFSDSGIKEESRYNIFKNFQQKSNVEKSSILKLLAMKIPPYRISDALQKYEIEGNDENKIVSDIIQLIFDEEERNNQDDGSESEGNGTLYFSMKSINALKNSIPFLQRVSSLFSDKNQDIVEEGEIECLICFETKMVDPYILKCSHKFCFECLKSYFSDRIKNGKIEEMPCPQDNCTSKVDDEELSKLVSEEMFAKYEYFKMRKELDKDPDIRWCTDSECGKCIKGKKGDSKIVCECGQEICFKCSMPWHEGKSCDENTEEFFGKYTSIVKVRNCPSCNSRIEKIDGCNHMTCSRCHYQFCWNCLKKYSRKHYSPNNWRGCPGMMFGDYNSGPTCCKKLTIIICHFLYFIIILPFSILFAFGFSLFGPLIFYTEFEFKRKRRMRRKGVRYNKSLRCLRIFCLSILVFVLGIALSPLIFTLSLVPGSCIFYYKRLNS